MQKLPPLINSDTALASLCSELEQVNEVAIDTEFERERTYFPTLCLMQLATAEGLAIVDPLGDVDLAPLFKALSRPGLIKILHAARQDLEIFYLHSREVPGPVFDTQLAAACLGLGEQISYSKLVGEVLDVDLGKSHARTDWKRRPLSDSQLNYAADDVTYLLELHGSLKRLLQEKRREDWLHDEFAMLSEPALYAPQPALAYQRIRAHRNLDAVRRARLARLAEWREQEAIRRNLPRRWVIADKPLLDLAALDGSDEAALQRVQGIPQKLAKREVPALLEILRSAGAGAAAFSEDFARPTARQNKLLKKLSARVRAEAERLRTSPALLANRDQLQALAGGQRDDNPVLQGWRRDIIGEKLLDLLEAEPVQT